jgi:site-specific recombinase XerD
MSRVSRSREGQLWEKASEHFELRRAEGEGRLAALSAPRMCALYWPDGRPCWQVNAYLIWMRARLRKVSTVNTYGSDLSPLIRFLAQTKSTMDSVDDQMLIQFGNWLQGSGRKGSRVNQIIGRALKFLEWYQGRSASGRKLIGLGGDGAQITVELTARRHGRSVTYGYAHPAMTSPSVPRTVVPMPMVHSEGLLGAIHRTARRSFIRARNGALFTLLRESGVRRTEVTSITKRALEEAVASNGRLNVRNAKRTDGSSRVIPIDMTALETVMAYVTHQRAILMERNRKKNPSFTDPGWLFCKEDGQKISDEFVTKLFSLLRKAAGISARAHPHMLRHRWITLQLVRMIEQLQNMGGGAIAADLIVTLLSRLAILAGQKSKDSLWTYVDFASEELMRILREKQGRFISSEVLAKLGNLLEQLAGFRGDAPQRDDVAELLKDLRGQLAMALAQPSPLNSDLTAKLR